MSDLFKNAQLKMSTFVKKIVGLKLFKNAWLKMSVCIKMCGLKWVSFLKSMKLQMSISSKNMKVKMSIILKNLQLKSSNFKNM